jgi:hypothetical protein
LELKGERSLPVARATAWTALNDSEALKAAIPGCESFTALGDDAHEVAVNAAIGPVKARFKGKVQLADLVPPESYTIRFDLSGGAAGFSRGAARVRLEELAPHETRMVYEVEAQVGGKIAQVGSRLVDAAAATMADRFFASFAAQLAQKYPPPAGAPTPAEPPRAPGWFASLLAFLRRLFTGR